MKLNKDSIEMSDFHCISYRTKCQTYSRLSLHSVSPNNSNVIYSRITYKLLYFLHIYIEFGKKIGLFYA